MTDIKYQLKHIFVILFNRQKVSEMVNSKIKRPLADFDPHFSEFADELISLAEFLKSGISSESPLSIITSAILDLALLAGNIADSEFGFRWDPDKPGGKELSNPADPLEYEVDELMNRLTISWAGKGATEWSESIGEAFDFIVDITSKLLSSRSNFDLSEFLVRKGSSQTKEKQTRKLSREEFFFFRRKWATHKRTKFSK